jgi:hypothetical protein
MGDLQVAIVLDAGKDRQKNVMGRDNDSTTGGVTDGL